MKAEATEIKPLNNALKTQMVAINQFFLHAKMLKNWGLDALGNRAYSQSIKAMKLADKLMERILFLEGLPNLQDLGKLIIGEDAPESLQGDLQMQTTIRKQLQSAISDCEGLQDYVSRDLLEELLRETEEHIDWIETQQWLIEHLGLENYLQSQI